MDKEYLFQYWGKAYKGDREITYHPLVYHCLDVSAVGSEYLKKNHGLRKNLSEMLKCDESIIITWVSFFLALHDCGKFSEEFQNIIPELFKILRGKTSNKGYTVNHDSLGFLYWQDKIWNRVWNENWFGLNCDNKDERRCRGIFDYWSAAFTGHHGKPPRADNQAGTRIAIENHFSNEDIENAINYVRQVKKLFIIDKQQDYTFLNEVSERIRHASWLLAGIAVVSDWLGSNHEFFPFNPDFMSLSEYLEEKARVQAERAVYESGILPAAFSYREGMKDLFPSIKIPSSLQNCVESIELNDSPQLFIIEDLTGSGKTEAAIVLAGRLMKRGIADGVFIALPTMATSNAMYERVTQVYRLFFREPDSASLVLAHSARELSDTFKKSILLNDETSENENVNSSYRGEGSAKCRGWVADNRKKALMAHFGVGTIDQALLGVLPSKHQSLRLLGLSRKILIVDEVHSYDSYMNMLIRNLLRFHASLGGSVVLLSATLPLKIRNDLIHAFQKGIKEEICDSYSMEYPLLTHSSGKKISEMSIKPRVDLKRRIDVEFLYDFESVINEIKKCFFGEKCICWIRNTVYDACLAYESLCKILPENRIILFHSRFAMCDRIDIEKKVLKIFGKSAGDKERKNRLLIATQVVEQSLDLDFDELITDLAPIDLIIQRAGRLHRHSRDIEGNILFDDGMYDQRGTTCLKVYSPPVVEEPDKEWYKSIFPGAAYVYPNHGQLWLAAKLLGEKNGWTQPDDARKLIEGVYGDEGYSIPDNLLLWDDKAYAEDMAARGLARINGLDFNKGYFATPESWLEDTQTPTRLGEITTTIRLAKWDGSNLIPWAISGSYSWSLSEVNIPGKFYENGGEMGDLCKAIVKAKKTMQDKGEWSVVLPLIKKGNNLWLGSLQDHRGNNINMQYSANAGLHNCKKGDYDAI